MRDKIIKYQIGDKVSAVKNGLLIEGNISIVMPEMEYEITQNNGDLRCVDHGMIINHQPPAATVTAKEDMKRLLNTQYADFILDHVVRPYQGMLGFEQRIERLMFVRTDEPGSINYADLIIYSNTRSEWFGLVIDRLASCYSAIDFSFFPNEAFAQDLQKALIVRGVRSISYFNNLIYANVG